MTERLKILNQRQNEAVEALMHNDGRGTIKAVTAFGKTFTSFKYLYRLLQAGKISYGAKVWYWAETNIRYKNVEAEGEKFLEVYGKNPLVDFNFEFPCYQSLRVGSRDVDIYDEFDVALTPKYHYVVLNAGTQLQAAFTATNDDSATVYRSEIDDMFHGTIRQSDAETAAGEITTMINKGQLLEILLPVVYEYSISLAIDEGIISPFETVVVNHKLDSIMGDIQLWKTKQKYGHEQDYYGAREYIKTAVTASGNYRFPRKLRSRSGKEQAVFMYELRSKIEVVRALLYLQKLQQQKTIVFGVRKSLLHKITPHVCEEKTTATIIENFNNDFISDIASAKKIKRGITLKGVTRGILASYYSTSTDYLQSLGRLLRYQEGKLAKIYIFRTQNTIEEEWFDKLGYTYDDQGQIKERINMNITSSVSSREIIQTAKEHGFQ